MRLTAVIGLVVTAAAFALPARAQQDEREIRPRGVPAAPRGAPAPTPAPPEAAAPATAARPEPPPPPPPGRIAGKVTVLDRTAGAVPGQGALVYLETVDPKLWGSKRAPVRNPTVTMRDKKFEPRVVAVLAGRKVSFPNTDPVFHNVFSLSSGNRFDLGLYKNGKSADQAFATPGIVRVFCNIHPGMKAYVVVTQNPWWASVDEAGAWTLADVPPGEYVLKVWHERGGESSQPVTVAAGQRVAVDFELDARSFKVVPHKNKAGEDYAKRGY